MPRLSGESLRLASVRRSELGRGVHMLSAFFRLGSVALAWPSLKCLSLPVPLKLKRYPARTRKRSWPFRAGRPEPICWGQHSGQLRADIVSLALGFRV